MSTVLQLRRGTMAQWSAANPVLAQGEPGYATDAGIIKVGNGSTPWLDLPTISAVQDTAALNLATIADPGPSVPGKLTLYAKAIGGRGFAKTVGPSGLDSALQPFLARNKIGLYSPVGNSATANLAGGYIGPSATGTVTARNVGTANLFQRMRRLGLVSAATAGAVAGLRINAAAQVSVGGDQLGSGFFKEVRFGISDPVLVAGARMFVGVSAWTSIQTNVDPYSQSNLIGLGHGEFDTNFKIFWGGSAAQTPIDLGPNFPCNTSGVDVYDLALFAPPVTGVVHYEVTRLNTGHVATGTLSGAPGIALPAQTTLLSYQYAWRSNHTTPASVGWDIMSDYVETDF